MSREWIDCRDLSDEENSHGAEDTAGLREWLRGKPQDEAVLTPA
jgi:hypothetical protein